MLAQPLVVSHFPLRHLLRVALGCNFGRTAQKKLRSFLFDTLRHFLHLAQCLSLFSVLLVQNVFVLSHALGLSHAVLLAFLIPAPLVDLGLCQICQRGDQEQRLLRPVGICFECIGQLLQLTGRFPLALADNTLHLAVRLVKHVATALRIVGSTVRHPRIANRRAGYVYVL